MQIDIRVRIHEIVKNEESGHYERTLDYPTTKNERIKIMAEIGDLLEHRLYIPSEDKNTHPFPIREFDITVRNIRDTT